MPCSTAEKQTTMKATTNQTRPKGGEPVMIPILYPLCLLPGALHIIGILIAL